jgi:subtilisin family serine protease
MARLWTSRTGRCGATALVAGLIIGLVLAAAPAAESQPDPLVTVIVRLQSGGDVDAQAQRATDLGGSTRFRYRSALRGFALRIPQRAVDRVRQLPQVVSVELDTPVRATATESTSVWGLDRIDQAALPLSGTYSYRNTGTGITAYVLDTGIMATHQDFGGRVRAGYTAITDGNAPTTDCNSHGTHVAGSLAGATFGVAKRADLVPVRVLGCDGSGSMSGVIAGLDWVTAQHAAGTPAVANLSLGGSISPSLDDALRNLVNDGVTVAVAAGNDNADACNTSPARVSEAITVGASTRTDGRASYSNFGSCVDLFAPGDKILSAGTSDTAATSLKSGTSMATPHVAGAAAVLLSEQPGLSPTAVTAQLNAASVSGAVTTAGSGSPNRLLHIEPSAGPTITAPGNQTGTVGVAVNLALTAAGGTTPYSWSATGLPAGLAIDPRSGAISGTPTAATSGATVTVTATDRSGQAGTTGFNWTVQAAPVACAGAGQRLVNPGFEAGTQGWTAGPGVIGQTGPRTGSWSARLGGTGVRSTSTLEQSVSIPSGCRTYRVSMWLRVDSAETGRGRDDTLTVTLGTTRLAAYSSLDRGAGWVERTFDVSRYAGRTAKLTAKASEDRGLATTFGLDDVTLTVG